MLQGRSQDNRLVERVGRECARARDPLDLFEAVAALVRDAVPYRAAGWILIDPDTMLMSAVFAEEVPFDLHLELIGIELGEEDINKFWSLAHRRIPAAALSAATNGHLDRSTRWAQVYGPNGYGDELRAVFATARTAWGHACLTRAASDPPFSAREVDLVAAITPHVANGIRSSHLLGLTEDDAAPASTPAMVVLADDGTTESCSPKAVEWFGDLDDPSLRTTIVLHEVARQARTLADGTDGHDGTGGSDGTDGTDGTGGGPPAVARVRALTGEWVLVRGVRLDDVAPSGATGPRGRTALVLEAARGSDLAPILVALHDLTDREREVTQLLLRGMSIADISRSLWISPQTVRGHVKSIFAKLEVSSRPELAALLSREPRSRVRPDEPAAPRSR